MKSGLPSNLTRAFVMKLDLVFGPDQQAGGTLGFGLLGKDDFLVPVNFPLPRELAPAVNAFVAEAEKWVAKQEVLFAPQSNNEIKVVTLDAEEIPSLVTEGD